MQKLEGSSDTSDVSLSCLFSSFESEDWEDSHSAEDDTGTVEPYQFEPEVTDNETHLTQEPVQEN